MEKRINLKIDNFFHTFKKDVKSKIDELGLINTSEGEKLLQYIYDYSIISLNKTDMQKRKRVKNTIPLFERCCALRANMEQCTRRRKDGEKFCGTHIKGIPHGEVTEGEEKQPTSRKLEVWAQEIKGIIYYIDKNNNVYDPQNIYENVTDPAVIAKYVIKDDGEYSIPSMF